MDWLLTRQDRIQKKLAGRHLAANGLVLRAVTVFDGAFFMIGEGCEM